MIARDDGTPDFHALRSQRRGHEAVLYAFDLIEHDGNDLRDLPLIERKRRLARLLGKAKRPIRFTEHLTDDGPTVFEHAAIGRVRPRPARNVRSFETMPQLDPRPVVQVDVEDDANRLSRNRCGF